MTRNFSKQIIKKKKKLDVLNQRLTNLENCIKKSQDTSFLPFTMEGEAELAQIKDRIQVILPDGTTKTEWVTGKNKATFYDNLVRKYAEYDMLERLGIQIAKPIVAEPETKQEIAEPEQEVASEMPTFKQYTDKLLSMRRDSLRPNTQKGYDSLMRKHFVPCFGEMMMNEITWFTIQEISKTQRKDIPLRYILSGPAG
jgi:hypothetical protein